MKILVTGSHGQLGQTIMNSSHDLEHEFVFSARTVKSLGSRPCRHPVIPLDISDFDAVSRVVRDNGIDVIINCAGYTDVAGAESEREKAFMANATAVSYIADAARDNDAVLIHISTDYVFDGLSSVPYKEDDPANPLSVYGRSKLEGERLVAESGCRHIIIRTSWLFSPYGRNFLKTILRKSEEHPVLNVVSDQIGTPTCAADLMDAVFGIIDAGMLDRTGLYHYSNEGVCSWYDFAKAICEESGRRCSVTPCSTNDYPSPVNRPHYSVLDKGKFMRTFGVEIPYWRDSMSSCIGEIEKFG